MATKPIRRQDIPAKANPGRTGQYKGQPHHPRADDVRAFLQSGDHAHEVILEPGENPSNVYTALINTVRAIHAGEHVRVTRRYDRIFLIRIAPFTHAAQFKG